jgi:hypothetical protein
MFLSRSTSGPFYQGTSNDSSQNLGTPVAGGPFDRGQFYRWGDKIWAPQYQDFCGTKIADSSWLASARWRRNDKGE